jgi:hypothetical protein
MRNVYDKKYYKLKILIKSDDFIEDVRFFRESYRNLGISFPEEGYVYPESYSEYFVPTVYNFFDQYLFNPLDEKRLPPDEVLMTYIDDCKRTKKLIDPGAYKQALFLKYKLPDDSYHETFIHRHLFFGHADVLQKPTWVELVRKHEMETDDGEKKFEILIHVEPWAQKEDIEKSWDKVMFWKKIIHKDNVRNREPKNIERDVDIYHLFRKYKEKGYTDFESANSIWVETMDDDLLFENIKTIYHRLKKIWNS